MKKLLLLLTLAFTLNANAQDDKTVTLVVSGQGKTQEEAKQNALRSAIEQAFGTFISSKTEILNDNLVKDEIVSVTNGNIQKYEVLSEVQIPNGGYATSLKAIVSVSKLTSFCESKGVEVEFKGAAFAMNIKLQKLNEEAEFKAILNLCEISKEILSKSIDYSLEVSEPVSYKGSNDNFSIEFTVNCMTNKNLRFFHEYFWKTITGITMTQEETDNYKKLQKLTYILVKYNGDEHKLNQDSFQLRNSKSLLALKNLIIKSNDNLLNFRILSEVDTIFVKKCCISNSVENTSNVCYGCYYDHYKDIPDFWQLDFGVGFPPAARLRWRWYKNYSSEAPWVHLEKTGRIYFELLKSTGKQFVLTNKENYFTSSYVDFEKYDNGEGGEKWLSETEQHIPLDLIIYNDKFSLFKFKYNHILKLEKLEKISKYNIEPWENKSY